MKKTIQLKESDITRMVMEAVNELDWKTYANAAKKRQEQGADYDTIFNLQRAADLDLKRKYGGQHLVDTRDEGQTFVYGPHYENYAKRPLNNNKYFEPVINNTYNDDAEYYGFEDISDFVRGNYEYKPYKEGGKGWTKKNESIVREAVNRTLRKYIR